VSTSKSKEIVAGDESKSKGIVPMEEEKKTEKSLSLEESPTITPIKPTTKLGTTEPFYLVDQVFEDSPAFLAGLKIGDKVLQFGSITRLNKSADAMQKLVKHSTGKKISVTVYRLGEGQVYLQLTPQHWQGRGLLGCNLKDI